ncbi:hypothetical protein ACIA8G_42510 [Lentzea sp. NPDC051213]|uniref:hypothetical protein n=1 Tax=Lentzea sp. NPDC051213 TaxID=3364126 RepID=UPI0037BD89B4
MHKAVVLALLLVALASCGRPSAATPGSTPGDPGLTSAARVVEPRLETEFAVSYAGLELRHEVPMMVVHRKPDPALDAAIAEATPNVRVVFRDARYTRVEMRAAAQQVMNEAGHWLGLGVTVVSAAARVDGSGVAVQTSGDAVGVASRLQQRYPAMTFHVEKAG